MSLSIKKNVTDFYCRSLDEELEVMWPIFSERSPPAAGNATETDDIFNSWNTYEC